MILWSNYKQRMTQNGSVRSLSKQQSEFPLPDDYDGPEKAYRPGLNQKQPLPLSPLSCLCIVYVLLTPIGLAIPHNKSVPALCHWKRKTITLPETVKTPPKEKKRKEKKVETSPHRQS
ncbi:hypothetical protein TWF225_010514 [Orbilia oligospora]|uniref:Uncharacterized protein n=1 Tax=Orbilia oligospora TaxID=2813651 RepID=A0A7C8K810_ORBOL|nr:hypothetical protein TWF751_009717 [Orbilia oligospora]KAF3171655.1 hypothetical protein TWF225_010514 [Orbilia oligospora]KAF3242892.1 hypothetical protein TWF128_010359 [Orbilia oligospora]KAF3260339.1 hypothetical protein TWF217_004912 [Orbilia oligospora]KAF3278143.1 hypothetical protein TWF132_001254 [Orbilia oligospora]